MPDDDEVEEVNEHTPLEQVRAAHRRATARAAELETQLSDLPRLARENAAMRAGIDVESPIGQLFVNSYTGDVTPDAMKEAFSALGVQPASPPVPVTPPATEGDEAPSVEELDEMRRRGGLGGNSTPPGGEPVKPLWDEAFENFHANLRKGMDRKQAGAGAIQLVLDAAANPQDPRHTQAIFDSESWARENIR